MVDISSMSKAELKELREQINCKLHDEYNIPKKSLIATNKIRKIINPKNKDFWDGEKDFRAAEEAVNAVTAICDYTLRLYKSTPRRQRGRTINSFSRETMCPRNRVENYSLLAAGIIGLMEKYVYMEETDESQTE